MRKTILSFTAAIAITVASAFATQAGENAFAPARLAIWTPDPWIADSKGEKFSAHNPPETLGVIAVRLKGAAANAEEAARDFIDEEFDDVKFTGPGLAGTAKDDGDEIEFTGRVVVDGGDALLALTVGELPGAAQGNARQLAERIRASLKAQ